MKNLLSITIFPCALLLFSCGKNTQNKTTVETKTTNENGYDSLLARELGADKYGMHQYVMAFLKAGPNRDRDSADAAQLQRAHQQNIRKMAEDGKLLVAGPFLDDGAIRGIYIFNVPTVEEAEALTNTDPAIQAGSLIMELHPWYGSAALQKLSEIHPRIARENP